MAITSNLNTPEGVQHYLASSKSFLKGKLHGNSPNITVIPICGGQMNHTYRAFAENGATFIIKYAPPTVALNTSCPLTSRRGLFEYCVLLHVPTFKSSTPVLIQTPKAIHYDDNAHILVTSDIGCESRTLKECLIDDSKSLNIDTTGRALGEWLANLHLWGRTKAAAPLRAVLSQNTELANAGIEYAFKSLVPNDDPLWKKVRNHVDNLRRLDKNDSEFVVHGDFLTGNVLVSGEGHSQLTVIDWETSNCRNFTWNDVGQMCSEMYQATFFGHARNRGEELMSAFVKGYLSKRDLSEEERRMAVIRFGVHLFVWPEVTGWGNKESIARGKKLGREFIERAWNYDWNWLRNSVVRELVPEASHKK